VSHQTNRKASQQRRKSVLKPPKGTALRRDVSYNSHEVQQKLKVGQGSKLTNWGSPIIFGLLLKQGEATSADRKDKAEDQPELIIKIKQHNVTVRTRKERRNSRWWGGIGKLMPGTMEKNKKRGGFTSNLKAR